MVDVLTDMLNLLNRLNIGENNVIIIATNWRINKYLAL